MKLKEVIKIAITWTGLNKERLNKLNAGRGNRKGLYVGKQGMCLITAEQVMDIKRCLESDQKMSHREIIEKTGTSEYYIRNTKKGKFDHLLE